MPPRLSNNVTWRQVWRNQEWFEFLRVSVSCPTGSRWHFGLHPISRGPWGDTGKEYMVQRKLPMLVWDPWWTGVGCWALRLWRKRGHPCRKCSQFCLHRDLSSNPWEGRRWITWFSSYEFLHLPPFCFFLLASNQVGNVFLCWGEKVKGVYLHRVFVSVINFVKACLLNALISAVFVLSLLTIIIIIAGSYLSFSGVKLNSRGSISFICPL